MAWFKTNNPVTGGGDIQDGGRIIDEICKAINEREHMMGRSETSFPSVIGDKVNSSRAWINQMRSIIDTDLIEYNVSLSPPLSNTTVYACDSSWNHYTWAGLYNAAMGSGSDWAKTVQGLDVDDASIFEEMMKCLELLQRWEVGGGFYQRAYGGITRGGAFDTSDAIHAGAVAGGMIANPVFPSLDPNNAGVMGILVYDNNADKYESYGNLVELIKLYVPGPGSAPLPTSRGIAFTADIVGSFTYDRGFGDEAVDINNLSLKFRTISAAEFATPAWAGDGTLQDSETISSAGTDVVYYFTGSWLGFNQYEHFRFDGGTGNPFATDPNKHQATYDFHVKSTKGRWRNTSWTYG